MADILGKDQATYSKEHDGFLRDLQHFHETRGTPFKRAPILGGKEVDLYLLYSLVTSQGGWIKVNSKNGWPEILQSLKIPRACINVSVALKQIYIRYLDRFEKVHFLHEEPDRASDDDEESRHKRWSARTLHSVPYSYNYNQHNITESNRESSHLSTDLYKPSDYDRLALSLISPLPNEQDFAINVCTLLSNDGKHTLKLEKHPRILNYLLGHAGIFTHSSLRELFRYFYNGIRRKPIDNFWKDVLESKEFLDLTNEDKFKLKQDEAAPKYDSILKDDTSLLSALEGSVEIDKNVEGTCDVVDSDSDIEIEETFNKFKFKIDESVDRGLFCLRRSLGTQDYIGQRVLQIATILRNLSFIEENVPVLVKNSTFIRFLLLCVTSQWGQLKNLGMDMLGNIASDFVVRDLQIDILARNLIKIVTRGLESPDRAYCLCSLEVLNKLSQNEQNEDVLLRSLQAQVYKSVCSFLSIHDVMLLIYTLECLYSLSSLGERSCNLIVVNHGVIDTLVSLVTVEGKSYGPKACIGMKLVETVPTGQAQNIQTSQQSAGSTTAANTSPVQTNCSNTSSNLTSTTLTSTTSVTNPIITSSPVSKSIASTPTTPARSVQVIPKRPITMTPAQVSVQNTGATTTGTPSVSVSQILTPQQLIQQQHAHQQVIHENEQFALAWLRATYEPCSSGKIEQQELYKQYLNSCSKIGRPGVISPLHFPRCVRSVFGGTVGPNPVKPANANDPQFYEGIKVREKPLLINIQMPSVPKSTTNITTTKGQQVRRKSVQSVVVSPAKSPSPSPSTALSVVADTNATEGIPMSPASPILKAQLSAPPKQRETVVTPTPATVILKGDSKSQAMAHPHLSQALLGTSSAPPSSTVPTLTIAASQNKDNQYMQSNSTSLIKSLLATKVNDCMSTVSMRTATDCQNLAQVAARQQQQQQQRLLAQQTITTPDSQQKMYLKETPKSSRINGVRQLFCDNDIGDPSVSSTTQFTSLVADKKEPPQPPPPPLAPLSNVTKGKPQRIDNEDSDSLGNNSLASSSGIGTVGIGGISSTEDGDNSLTSFEGLLNGMPTIENPLNEDSNSKDSSKVYNSDIYKPLRLADLLEKKIEKSPLLNGALGKELRLGDKSLDLVENHIEKVLSRDNSDSGVVFKREVVDEAVVLIKSEVEEEVLFKNDDEVIKSQTVVKTEEKGALKRSASEELIEIEAKKPHLSNINGSTSTYSPPPESISSSNGEDSTPATVSTAAAKLFADIAADILEDEDEEQLLQESQMTTQIIESPAQVQISTQAGLQQIMLDNNQQVLLAQPRQIIVSQAQLQTSNQVVFSAGTQLKTPTGQTVIVQNTAAQRPVMIQQTNSGQQFLLSQNIQGQMQLVASSQAGQYVIQTGGQQGAYVVAQPQTAVVHGQPQTVLLAQTSQQQGTGAKTIIILQQQPSPSPAATHHQKVVVTPQGQQMVVTQVPRPIVHTSTISNTNLVPSPSKIIKTPSVCSTSASASTPGSASNGINAKKTETETKKTKPTTTKDMASPYICEWNDCLTEEKFKSANEVYLHACAAHCPTDNEEVICQWDRCDNMKRRRFSLMTHLHDKHCNTESMRQSLLRRKQTAHSTKIEPSPAPSTSIHPGYAPDAALHAIKRHAMDFVNPKELQDDNEGPVTKSIRLTASLILRNLVIYSSHCKRYLKSYESHLANVALSNVESSRTIAQVLYDMNDGSTHR